MKAGCDGISSANSVKVSIVPMFDIETGGVTLMQSLAGHRGGRLGCLAHVNV